MASAETAVTLEQVEQHALKHAPGVARARAAPSQRAAIERGASQRWTSNPSAQLLAGPRLTPQGQGVDLQLSLSQALPLWGLLDAQRELARADMAQLDAELDADRALVRGQVRAAWAQLLWAKRRVAVAERAADLAHRIASAVAAQVDAGESAMLDARLTQADAAQADAALESERARLEQARLQLITVAGWPDDAALPLPDALPTPAALPPLDRLRPHRRTLIALERRVQAAQAEVKVAERGAGGQLGLGAQLQREGNPEGAEWVVFAGLSYTPALWQRGQVERAQAQADLERARVEHAAAARALVMELKQRYAQAEATYKRWQALDSALLPRFEEDMARVERAWQLGELRLIEALSARERLLKLELDAADAWGAHLEARAALDALLEQETP